ncbi:DUF4124 domain-containing protein [Pseudomonas sp. NA-150]|uniref:DUF4124 domain-containing protein n=1 Tax=Pseudomonas sp. NA-150 TaxID=3367525 RepID=UPI0037C86168
MSKTKILSPMMLFTALLTCAGWASAGAVYTCTDADGKRIYQQVPCSIDSLENPQASGESQRQDAALQAASADFAQRIKALEVMMENDEKLNQGLEQKGR